MEEKIIGITQTIFVIAMVVVLLFAGCISNEEMQNEGKNIVENVSMKIYGQNWTISYTNITTANTTVYALLLECASHYDFAVKATYWGSYDSILIDSINGTENGENGHYWQYYVNGTLANVGCDKYVLHNNDVVEWKFEQPAWP